ncbi:MAG: YHYH protein [Phycisphaera sp.]|nr:YHYH protein [Phycisphaera sp.]
MPEERSIGRRLAARVGQYSLVVAIAVASAACLGAASAVHAQARDRDPAGGGAQQGRPDGGRPDGRQGGPPNGGPPGGGHFDGQPGGGQFDGPPGGPPGGGDRQINGVDRAVAHGPAKSSGSGVDPGASIVRFEVRDGYRYVTSNGIPNHTIGQFPNYGNPNSIAEQKYSFRMPANPRPAERVTANRMQLFGVAINGVPFDPGAAEWWNGNPRSGWTYNAMAEQVNLGVDDNHAHIQPNGAYHYHGIPTGLFRVSVDAAGNPVPRMELAGFAADGYMIFGPVCHDDPKNVGSALRAMKPSYRVHEGERPAGDGGPGGAYNGLFVEDYVYVRGAGDLDECNGHVAPTPSHPEGVYHYHLTEAFPYIPRYWRGTPDDSFNVHRGPGGRGGPGGQFGGQGGQFGGPPGQGGQGQFGPPNGGQGGPPHHGGGQGGQGGQQGGPPNGGPGQGGQSGPPNGGPPPQGGPGQGGPPPRQ